MTSFDPKSSNSTVLNVVEPAQTPVIALTQAWLARNAIRALDCFWVEALLEQAQEQDDVVLMAGVLCSAYLGMGHICLPLAQLGSAPLDDLLNDEPSLWQAFLDAESLTSIGAWEARLQNSSLVSVANASDWQTPQQRSITPMVLEGGNLYLTRYFYYETTVFQGLRRFSKQPLQTIDTQWLNHLFPASTDAITDIDQVDWQKVAVASAASLSFSVISGGPGTGKTTTVTKLLALLVQQAMAKNETIRIKLSAPTGKAAARLTESITRAKTQLPLAAEILDKIPERAATLHRLLGANYGRSEYQHHSDNPLHLDVLIVDEVSMVDLPMMAKLMQALPAHARLILLGDKDQLASVEAGGVLADMTQGIDQWRVSPDWNRYLEQQTRIDFSALYHESQDPPQWLRKHLTLLAKSYRFDGNSTIGLLAKAVNEGNERQALLQLKNDTQTDVIWQQHHDHSYDTMIRDLTNGYRAYWEGVQQEKTLQEMFVRFNAFQVLCAVRGGDFGVEVINDLLEEQFKQRGYITTDQAWYAGKAIMISKNDTSLGLFNGDVGLCALDSSPSKVLRVWFQMSDGEIKGFLPSRIGQHETVYAMTVHKSQGSEFEKVSLVMPIQTSPVLTKELFYTGITRAKKQFVLWGHEKVVITSLRNQVLRFSGLQQRLWQAMDKDDNAP